MAEIKNYYLDLTGLQQYDQLIKEYINGKDLAIKGDLVVGKDYETIKALSDAIKELNLGDKNIIESVSVNGYDATIKDKKASVTIPEATKDASGVMSAKDKTKLDGIAEGAQVNVQADWAETNTESDAYIKNKPTDLVTHSRTIAGINLADDITKTELLTALNVADGAQVNKIEAITVNGATATITDKTASVTIPAATQSASGVMSAKDKTKLDGIATGAEVNYIKSVGNNLAVDNAGKLTVTVSDATKDASGFMSAADKTKLDGIATGAEVNKIDAITVNGVTATIENKTATVTIPEATTSKSGVMSTADKTKLDGLANIKSVGDNLAVDNAGKLTVSIPAAKVTDVDGTTVNGLKLELKDKKVTLVDDGLTNTLKSKNVTVRKKADTADDQCVYEILQGETVVGTINHPKDMVVTGGEVIVASTEEGLESGEKYLKLTIANQDKPVYIAVKDLVDVYKAGNGIEISKTNEISVKLALLKAGTKDIVSLNLTEDGLSATLTGWDDVKKAVNALGTTYAPLKHTHSIDNITDFAPIPEANIAKLFTA